LRQEREEEGEDEEGQENEEGDDEEADLDDVELGVEIGAGVSDPSPLKRRSSRSLKTGSGSDKALGGASAPASPVPSVAAAADAASDNKVATDTAAADGATAAAAGTAATTDAATTEAAGTAAAASASTPAAKSDADSASGPRKVTVTTVTAFEDFQSPFDENGVLYYLSTYGNTKPYQNPQLTGVVRITMSSIYKGRLHTVVERNNPAMPNYTNNTRNSWVMIDLGEHVRLVPTRYCIRHGGSGKGNALRNWELRARQNVTDHWTLLRSHQRDDTLSDYPGSTASWKITPKAPSRNPAKKSATDIDPAAYRYFLVVQVGPNSSSNDCLFIGGIDFYGTLTELANVKGREEWKE
jgi:hypothetical protein